MSRSYLFRFRPLAILLASGLVSAVGCREQAVSYYEVPREKSAPAVAGGTGGGGAPGASAREGAPHLEWDKPAVWTEQPPSQMRLASYLYTAPDGTKADVSVFVFPDAAGGLIANVNRWRDQVGLPAVAEADLNTTAEQTRIAGQAAWVVDFAGKPAGSEEIVRITGAIIPVGGQAWFFKMMGPNAVVQSQREAFDGMIRSIQAVVPSSAVAEARAPATAVSPGMTMPDDAVHAGMTPPAAGGTMSGREGEVPPPPATPTFSFNAPEHWQPQPPSAFRVVNFLIPEPAGGRAAQCYATPLTGAGGGEMANVNRWRRQVGLPAVDQQQLDRDVTTISGPAGTFRVFDLSGTDAQTGEPTRILAGILVRGDTSWFIRLTGVPAHVDRERPAFETFLRSISFPSAS